MKPDDLKGIKVRALFVATFYLGLFAIMIARGYQLQLFKGEELGERAERQFNRRIALNPVRGKILDRNGFELATNREAGSIYVHPSSIADPEAAIEMLATVLGDDRGSIRAKITSEKSFVWLKRGLLPEVAEKVSAIGIKGIGVFMESRRYYPNMNLAGHLIGFAGVDSQGLEGIERKYDDYIKGTRGHFMAERDALGNNIYPASFGGKGTYRGNDVALTIDKTIQHITERELENAVTTYSAKGGVAIVMDPHSGEILSMAVQPTFNPNFFERSSSEVWRNSALRNLFEPGSTFKIFLAAAAIDSGKVAAKDIFFCENGRFKVYDKYIHDVKEYGWLSMENILKVSSNIGAYKVAEKMGRKDYYRYIESFGFGKKTGIGLPEREGSIRPEKKLSPVGFANLAFGQGISVTAMQLLNAISAVANGGHLMRPYVVRGIVDWQGKIVHSNAPFTVRRVVSADSAKKITAMLTGVTSEEGTGGRAALEGYEVAGKTGTSQKYDVNTGRYSKDKFISSFVGFLPADSPKLSILVLLDEPKEQHYGGKVAAPVFRKIAEQALAHLKVVPFRQKREPAPTGDVKKKPLIAASWNRDSIVDLESKTVLMPDLRGLTLREILVKVGFPPTQYIGSGIVVEQEPLPGSSLAMEKGYRVRLMEEVSDSNPVSL